MRIAKEIHMLIKYHDGFEGCPAWTSLPDGRQISPQVFRRKSGESTEAFKVRILEYGAMPMQVVQPEGFDPDSHEKGLREEQVVNGVFVVTWPVISKSELS